MFTKFLQTALFLAITTFANAQVSQNMALIGNWNPGGFPTAGSLMYNDVWGYADCSGNEYAIMGGAAFYHFIDITNPGSPVEVASISAGNTTTWRDMKTYSKYAYGVCDSCNEGLSVFDLGDMPNSVTMVGQYTSSFDRAHNIFIDEGAGRLYAVGTNTQSNGVIVFDLNANPANPPEIARMSLPGGYMHDIFVRSNIGYGNSGGNGMWVYDFTDLNNVVTLGNITSYPEQGYNHAGWATDDNQGYVMADETHDKGLKYLDISDLSDISTTSVFRSELLAPAVTGSIAHNPFIRDNYAVVSYYHDGLQVFDISDPNNIIQTAWYDTYTGHSNYSGYSGNWGAYPFLPSGNILASDEFTGLYILNPTNFSFSPIPAPSPPSISIIANGPTNFCAGESVELSASHSGLAIQWYKDGILIEDATADNYIATEAGVYYAETVGFGCSAISPELTTTIVPAPDATLNVGNFNQICDNEFLTISVPAGGVSYSWTRNGSPLPQNSNAISVNQAGDYQVEVSNGSCSTLSLVTNLALEVTPDATLNMNGNQEICDGEAVNLSVTAGADNYQWTRNNVSFGGNMNFITVSTSGDYKVTVSNGTCSNESQTITFITNSFPDVALNNNGPIQLCDGQTEVLEVGSGADSYIWYQNGSTVVGTDFSLVISETGTYHVEAINGNCESISQTVTVEVGIEPDVTLNVPTNQSLCDGEVLEISVPAGADTYTWYQNGVVQSSSNNPSYFAVAAGDYYVLADINGCTSTSETVSISVEIYPDVDLNVPLNNEICTGETIEITIPSGAANYDWYQNGDLLPQNGNAIIVTETGDYQVIATNGNCAATSQLATVIVTDVPDVALSQPLQNEICAGESLPISVATGADNYQWFLDGNPLSNTAEITATTAGSYSVTASNGNCEITSETLTLIVSPFAETTLNVPFDNPICAGETIEISVPTGADTYEWYQNGDLLLQNINEITVSETGNYQVIAANGNCAATSEIATVEVTIFPNVNLSVPLQNEICATETLPISVATGADSYQWFLDGNPLANDAEIIATETGSYYVVATNGDCEATSETINLNVTPLPNVDLSVGSMNQICTGETLTIEAAGDADSFEWYQNGSLLPISGNTLTVSETGDYQLIATNGNCSATSEMVTVEIVETPSAELNVETDNELCAGETLMLEAIGGASNYQWFLNGEAIGNNEATLMAEAAGEYFVMIGTGDCSVVSETINITINDIPDTDLNVETENTICVGENLTIGTAEGADNYVWYLNDEVLVEGVSELMITQPGSYYVVANNGSCESISETIELTTVNPPNPSLTTLPNFEYKICEDESFTVSVAEPASAFQWFLNGEAVAGATDEIFITSDAGTYYVAISNDYCTINSYSFDIAITPTPTPQLVEAGNYSLCEGQAFGMSVITDADSFEWYHNGEGLGNNGPQFIAAAAGEYYVVAENEGCEGLSESVFLTINEFPEADIQTTAIQICPEETAMLSTPSVGQSYQWFLNGLPINDATDTMLEVSEGGIYSVAVTNESCTAFSVNVPISVFVPMTPEVVFDGQTLTTMAANSYQWLLNGNPIANATANTFVPTENGDYSVQITDANGCESVSEPFNVLLDAVQDVSLANNFLLYPNPVSNTLFLENRNENLQNSHLQIFNNVGQVIFTKSLNFVNNHPENIVVEQWAVGIYLLKIETNDGRFFVKRFVKE